MKQREKILACVIGGIVVVFGLGFAGKAVFQKPLKAWDARISAARAQLDQIKAERAAYFKNEAQVKSYAQRTFADQTDKASAKSGEMLTRLIVQSGLRESDFSRNPFGPRKLATALDTVEIGWSIQGEGKLEDVINLLFLLQESPYLQRIESLTVSDGDAPGRVRVNFRLLTLVIKPAPAVEFAELEPKYSLYSEQRKSYNGIVTRDLLRPYIKRPPPPPAPGAPAPPASSPGGPPPGPENYRIVSLSEWMGRPAVHLLDQVNQKTLEFKPGEALAGGTIVMVDYRSLPKPGDPFLQSHSRVIVKIGSEYWAVERGQTLAQKYRLNPEQLPEQLAKLVK